MLFNLPVNDLIKMNPGLSCSILQIGQIICVKYNQNNIKGCRLFYSINSGDICFSIAQSFNIPFNQFLSLNPGIDCNNLQIGQLTCLASTLVLTTTTTLSTKKPSCNQTYTVSPGDTCSSISLSFIGFSLNALISLNPGIDCNSLQIGQKLCVIANKINCSSYYTVITGDTCYSISVFYGISISDLNSRNPSLNCNNLQIGQKLCLNSAQINCSYYYTVKPGDQCYLMVNLTGISIDQFYILNPGINCNSLQIGQLVCLSSKGNLTARTLCYPNPCLNAGFCTINNALKTFVCCCPSQYSGRCDRNRKKLIF